MKSYAGQKLSIRTWHSLKIKPESGLSRKITSAMPSPMATGSSPTDVCDPKIWPKPERKAPCQAEPTGPTPNSLSPKVPNISPTLKVCYNFWPICSKKFIKNKLHGFENLKKNQLVTARISINLLKFPGD